MKTTFSALTLAAILGLSASAATAQPSGGPDAKGNAPLKAPHTVNNGSAKRGHTSFTEGQARTHIEKSGFSNVSGLSKGDDGVWRGQAMHDGRTVDVAMDFKGNVTTAGAVNGVAAATSHTSTVAPMAAPAVAPPAQNAGSETTTTTTTTAATTTTERHSHRHHRHHRRHHRVKCVNPTPNGAACSGVDKNHNGISDKEDRAIGDGAKP